MYKTLFLGGGASIPKTPPHGCATGDKDTRRNRLTVLTSFETLDVIPTISIGFHARVFLQCNTSKR